MTSIYLPPSIQHTLRDPTDWGTGETYKKNGSMFHDRQPNWQYGQNTPIKEDYQLTKLKLSGVRLNDQLLPSVGEDDIGLHTIQKLFPAEHPYASHIPRLAMFPKFDSPEDPRRGAEARKSLPKDAEMPGLPDAILFSQSVKGNPWRRDFEHGTSEGDRKPLLWLEKFDQFPKRGGRPTIYYPTPTKTFVPNLESRDNKQCITGDMKISEKSANAVRNIERAQWISTYNLAHTGLGSATAIPLDNYDQKKAGLVPNPEEPDDLAIVSTNRFDPARPWAGRIGKLLQRKPEPLKEFPDHNADPDYKRPMTRSEIEEDRMLNGREHPNLPETQDKWQDLQRDEEKSLGKLKEKQNGAAENIPYKIILPTDRLKPIKFNEDELRYLRRLDEIQQVEAQNRFQLLESQSPAHNLAARGRKMTLHPDKSQVKSFYDHEAKYQRERAGLYRTSYDPYTFQQSMTNEEKRGDALFNITGYQNDVLNSPNIRMNRDQFQQWRFGRTLGGPPGSVPQTAMLPAPHEVYQPFIEARRQQTEAIHPQVDGADAKTQEGGVLQKWSTYEGDYNTPKFLQERDVPNHARKEPLHLMSKENQNLNQVRAATAPGKAVQFKDDQIIPNGFPYEPSRVDNAPLDDAQQERRDAPVQLPTPDDEERTDHRIMAKMRFPQTPRTARFNEELPAISKESSPVTEKLKDVEFGVEMNVSCDDPYRKEKLPNTRWSWNGYPGYQPARNTIRVDMSSKNDDKFNWRAGFNTPRPQSQLLHLQDTFSKSEAHKRFHEEFPENNPDLTENIKYGRKHEFYGFNAQVLRGHITKAVH